MKAISYNKFGTSEVLNLIEIKKPIVKSNEVLVKIKHSSINKADHITMTGNPKLVRFSLANKTKESGRLLGCDFTGYIEEVGSEVKGYSVGDAIVGDVSNKQLGAYAEYISVSTTCITKVPKEVPLDAAAAIPVAGCTALQTINSINIHQGDEVLITGASGCVGQFALQLAKAKGATVTGVCSTNKISMLKDLGADIVIDYKKENILRMPKRYDYIINIAIAGRLNDYANILKPHGTHLLVGGDMKFLIKGLLLSPLKSNKNRQLFKSISSKVTSKDLNHLVNYIKDGTIRVKIDKSFPLIDTNLAMDYFESGKACGKIVINM